MVIQFGYGGRSSIGLNVDQLLCRIRGLGSHFILVGSIFLEKLDLLRQLAGWIAPESLSARSQEPYGQVHKRWVGRLGGACSHGHRHQG
jgi:hypothetical protein